MMKYDQNVDSPITLFNLHFVDKLSALLTDFVIRKNYGMRHSKSPLGQMVLNAPTNRFSE